MTVDYAGPIVADTRHHVDGHYTDQLYGEVSDNQTSVTFDTRGADLDPRYHSTSGYYYWNFWLYSLDNCNTSYTWSDNFVELSYVDDELNTIDLSALEDASTSGPDTGTCRECGSRDDTNPSVACVQ